MSDTDIYKKREPMPYGSRHPKRSSRRRRSSENKHAFDHQNRKRRSRNSGLRRMLHLYRKEENEKYFWWTALAAIIVALLSLGIWQFVIREQIIQKQNLQDDYIEYQQPIYEDDTVSAAQ